MTPAVESLLYASPLVMPVVLAVYMARKKKAAFGYAFRAYFSSTLFLLLLSMPFLYRGIELSEIARAALIGSAVSSLLLFLPAWVLCRWDRRLSRVTR